MNCLNSILLEGNLVEDPRKGVNEKTGTTVCFFRIVVGHSYKGDDDQIVKEVSTFEVETWGKLAEVCLKYLTKGRGVWLVGRLKTRKWSVVEHGDRESVVIMVEHVEFKPEKKDAVVKAAESV